MPDKRVGRARQGTHPKAPAPQLVGGHRALYTTASGQAAQKVLAAAARNDQRVDITVIDKQGNKHSVVSNRWQGHNRTPGKRAEWVKKHSGHTANSMKGFLAAASEWGDPATSDTWGQPLEVDDIAEIQILVYL